MQEVVDDIHKTDPEKQRIISKLIEFKEAIITTNTLNPMLNMLGFVVFIIGMLYPKILIIILAI